MSAISIHRPEFLGSVQDVYRNHLKFHRNVASCSMTMVFKSPQTIKKERNSIQISTPVLLPQSASNELRFNRPLPDDQELAYIKKLEFGQFVARKAVINEEIWTAAYLRAETHWENRTIGRHDEIYKKKFAEEEFKAIQKRCNGLYGQSCTCIVAVRNEQKHKKKLNLIKSVVGTLDISVRHLLYGETFPAVETLIYVTIINSLLVSSSSLLLTLQKNNIYMQEREMTHLCIINKEILKKYAYVSNLCVAKSARRQGIASNMLKFAIDTARFIDIEQLFVHVRRDNAPALALYEKLGFEVVEIASSTLLEVQKYLLCIDTQKVHLDVDIHS